MRYNRMIHQRTFTGVHKYVTSLYTSAHVAQPSTFKLPAKNNHGYCALVLTVVPGVIGTFPTTTWEPVVEVRRMESGACKGPVAGE